MIKNAGVVADNGTIVQVGPYRNLEGGRLLEFSQPATAIPGLIDAHTHLCWGGSRANDYARRLQGTAYQQIAKEGGGILYTVEQTRLASVDSLSALVTRRLDKQLKWGITTTEVKSGYGLSVKEELKILEAIRNSSLLHPIDVIPTCLAAHTLPPEYKSGSVYLNTLINELFPLLPHDVNRIDIFIEEGAFSPEEALPYLQAAKNRGFQITVHANQFSHLGAAVAASVKAVSADHLENLDFNECIMLKNSGVHAIALPGAAIGLGMSMPPARLMLDSGLTVAIASDWNPGSAPMGNLLAQAAILGSYEKLTISETLAGITCRAAKALGLKDRGVLIPGNRCDLTIFPTKDWREIIYYQGSLPPSDSIISGKRLHHVGR